MKINILETDPLYSKFDIKSEKFSLESFVANYNKALDICSRNKLKGY